MPIKHPPVLFGTRGTTALALALPLFRWALRSRGMNAGCSPRRRELSPPHGWVAARLYSVRIFLTSAIYRYSILLKNLRMPENFVTCIKRVEANRARTPLFDLQTEGAMTILDVNTSALDGFGPGHFTLSSWHSSGTAATGCQSLLQHAERRHHQLHRPATCHSKHPFRHD